ncbi:DUF6502 family protein [Vogesella sp. LIG4]|uniref:DUF6502 family protein n=1 Tax=Vogesella sp. LIG4 TaxID=1192162 RepID=UPI00081FBF97|nr:DUF6502 family protein [Vogesella sp. LIG4]SCK15362.1 hypothetical protein PSELUDRAFT_1521 [Vogesella sp. LIG4]
MLETSTPPKTERRFISTIEHMLRPLVRLLLDHGVGYPSLIEMLKATYVSVAERHFRLAEKAQTDSRISLLTGVHRKDVKRLRGDGRHSEADAPLAAQVLGRWTGDARFLDENKAPRVLPRLSRAGSELSFDALVQSINKDIRPRALLDEWLSVGVVTLDADDCVQLQLDSAVPSASRSDKLEFLGRNLHDHLAAVGANLRETPAPFMERCVFYDGLTPGQVAQLQAMATQRAMDTLLELNRTAQQMLASNGDSVEDSRRFNFGVYFFHEAADESER